MSCSPVLTKLSAETFDFTIPELERKIRELNREIVLLKEKTPTIKSAENDLKLVRLKRDCYLAILRLKRLVQKRGAKK